MAARSARLLAVEVAAAGHSPISNLLSLLQQPRGTPMSTYGQGEKKYLHPRGQVLLSSVGRGWSGIAADTRLPHLARPAPSVVEHPIIASNMETNGAIRPTFSDLEFLC